MNRYGLCEQIAGYGIELDRTERPWPVTLCRIIKLQIGSLVSDATEALRAIVTVDSAENNKTLMLFYYNFGLNNFSVCKAYLGKNK